MYTVGVLRTHTHTHVRARTCTEREREIPMSQLRHDTSHNK